MLEQCERGYDQNDQRVGVGNHGDGRQGWSGSGSNQRIAHRTRTGIVAWTVAYSIHVASSQAQVNSVT